MKTKAFIFRVLPAVYILFFLLTGNVALAQVDQNADTLKKAQTGPAQTASETKEKKPKKNEIVLYGGVNFTQLGGSGSKYESESDIGYQFGAYYKQGKFFYWQAGLRYCSAVTSFKKISPSATTEFEKLTVSDVDIPLTLGVNLLSATNRVLALRIFASAVPAFTMNVADNPLGITKDNVNSFVLYGQGGLGINVAFVVLEAGYNFGFNELLLDYPDSKPGQLFVNLGFRF